MYSIVLQIIGYTWWARRFVPVGKLLLVLWSIIRDRRRVMSVHVDGMSVAFRDDHGPLLPGGFTSWCTAVTLHQGLAIYGFILWRSVSAPVPGTSDGVALPMCLYKMCGSQRGAIVCPRFNIKIILPDIGIPIITPRLYETVPPLYRDTVIPILQIKRSWSWDRLIARMSKPMLVSLRW